jgi:hypothetical protein
MRRLSPTLIAVFMSGVCVGSFASQILSAVRLPPRSQAELALPATPGEVSSASLKPDGEAFLADLRAQQGSVLSGTSLDSPGGEADRAEFTAAIRDVREASTSAEGKTRR